MRGRPEKPIDLEQIKKLCAMHCTDEEIAAFFDVSTRTIERKKKNRVFAEMMQSGKAYGRASLRRLMWETAQGSGRSAATMQIWLSKNILGYADKVQNEHTGTNGAPIEIVDVRAKLADLIARRAPAQDAGLEAGEAQ